MLKRLLFIGERTNIGKFHYIFYIGIVPLLVITNYLTQFLWIVYFFYFSFKNDFSTTKVIDTYVDRVKNGKLNIDFTKFIRDSVVHFLIFIILLLILMIIWNLIYRIIYKLLFKVKSKVESN